MRITSLKGNAITLTDIDRGIASGNQSIYDSWNAKSDCGVPANGFIDVLDTERVMMSTELGQISKLVTSGELGTSHSITGTEVGPFSISGFNNTFEVQIGTGAVQSFTFASGSAVVITDIVSIINATATGFTAGESARFFRSSNTDNITGASAEGTGGVGYGVRGPSIMSGFLVLYGSASRITIGSGTSNSTLGLIAGNFTKCGR